MREKLITISERTFVYCLAGQLYEQAPNHKPRKADIIMGKAIQAFRNHENHAIILGDMHQVSIKEGTLCEFCDTLLKSIPEFMELNLSQNEYEKNISVDDLNRPKFAFTTRYDVATEDSWRDDFIDLDAFVNNVQRNIYDRIHRNNDCFLCTSQNANSESTLSPGDGDRCKTCAINPNHTFNYSSARYAKGEYTIVCNFDCYKSKYICCSECDNKDSCKHRCDSTPDKCNNHN